MVGVLTVDEVQAKSVRMNWKVNLSILHCSLYILAVQIEFPVTVCGYEGVVKRVVRAAPC